MESHRFEADVRQILHLVTHSLYSDREIFLRELVSNASDALDRARFEQLSTEDLLQVEGEPGVRIEVDSEAGTLTIHDDGIGMTQEQVIEHLGTIARSGTKAFAEALSAKGESSDGLIGQFGVGFYSAFMVADKVIVETLSGIPDSQAIRWESDGGDAYELTHIDRSGRGTSVTLHLREDAAEFLDEDRLSGIISKHSDFVAWPVTIGEERANQEAALWTRNPSDVTDDEYKAFYRHISNDWQEPLAWLHVKLEGTVSFNAVLFLPKNRPWEMDRLDFKVGLKLYQKRVMILEHADQLLPRNLRFVSGVVDAPDVSLNVSREMLQQTPVVDAIRKQLTKRLLKKLEEVSRTNPEDYDKAWSEYGHILKEGIAEDERQRKLLTGLLRYTTTQSEGSLRSLNQVKADLKEGEDTIWYYTSVDKERMGQAPVLEGFKKRSLEVVLMSDPVDEWVVMHIPEIDGASLKSVMTGEIPEEDSEESDPIAEAARKNAAPLVTWMKGMLDGAVADVRISSRLTDSPSVLVDSEGGVSSNMERILKAANQMVPPSQRVLEVNPEHPMVKTLAKLNADGASGIEPFARLLLDHAAIAEGRLDDPEGFAGRLQVLMERAADGMSHASTGADAPIEPEIVSP